MAPEDMNYWQKYPSIQFAIPKRWAMEVMEFSCSNLEQQVKKHLLCQQSLKGLRTTKDLAKVMRKS